MPQSKQRVFGIPRPHPRTLEFTRSRPTHRGNKFQPVPIPIGSPPFRLDIADALPAKTTQAIKNKKKMICHVVGDTGGVKFAVPQQLVANKMEQDFANQPDSPADNPAFFYHLGDVIYFNGESREYLPQFYEPYEHYLAPIIAIPGNHDADPLPQGSEATLEAFVRNFCSAAPADSPDAGGVGRQTMTQPHVYFTLLTPLATFIGLYTNVPEHGRLDEKQKQWFASELKKASKQLPVIVAMHHPIYSSDNHHSGSSYMGQVLSDAVSAAHRVPDMVLAAHVHNYQRFTRVESGRDVPYIVSGGGGYHNLHKVEGPNGERLIPPVRLPDEDVTLERYLDDRHGFLRLEFTPEKIVGKYFGAPRPQESWSAPARLVDQFELDVKKHRLVT